MESNQSLDQHFAVASFRHLFPDAEFLRRGMSGAMWYLVKTEPEGFVEVRIDTDGTTAIYKS